MISFGSSFGERMRDGYHECLKCGGRTMLVSAGPYWSVDQEAFKSGERTDDDEDVPDEVNVTDEVCGHWCDHCGQLTSFSFAQA